MKSLFAVILIVITWIVQAGDNQNCIVNQLEICHINCTDCDHTDLRCKPDYPCTIKCTEEGCVDARLYCDNTPYCTIDCGSDFCENLVVYTQNTASFTCIGVCDISKIYTNSPTLSPTYISTHSPTDIPTNMATNVPTNIPTNFPTQVPTLLPSQSPMAHSHTYLPSKVPTLLPSQSPIQYISPTYTPTAFPTMYPSTDPTFSAHHLFSTVFPTSNPTINPTNTHSGTFSTNQISTSNHISTVSNVNSAVTSTLTEIQSTEIIFPHMDGTPNVMHNTLHQIEVNKPTKYPNNSIVPIWLAVSFLSAVLCCLTCIYGIFKACIRREHKSEFVTLPNPKYAMTTYATSISSTETQTKTGGNLNETCALRTCPQRTSDGTNTLTICDGTMEGHRSGNERNIAFDEFIVKANEDTVHNIIFDDYVHGLEEECGEIWDGHVSVSRNGRRSILQLQGFSTNNTNGKTETVYAE